jgi:class 3 adenylate cyclase/tetratricopeptide (TPR) repeat protein
VRQERKVVTVLFCDLVGFTSQAEAMDPEDVAALLGPYHARLKEELERYGGTVEKFIGDAVMALFGAPVAHEDDPERAVRAALAIRDYASEEGIELRIGITTGEALVNLDARPDTGETMATGDIVNTAARLQAAAPVNGIRVSEKTYEATRQAVEYRAADPVEAKGKARPVPVWEALSAAPLQERAHTTPLVGRERELAQLYEALDRSREERTPQLVTIVGPPGIGKSRLVYELAQADTELTWRKGRCLPYGDGVPFWALGEIVKAHAGILESDPPETADQKLHACVQDAWIESHLRPLVGAGEGRETLGDRRAEAFSAWRRFLTTLAEDQPLALVLEDIHWADEGLLDFLTQLVEWAQEAPLLVLCTARPELLERRPGWGETTVPLAPLSDEETSLLLTALVETQASPELVARAAGNPLYAEQYARLVLEGGSLQEPPATVHGIISARLDGLQPDAKELLQDAAVVGRVFWSSAVAALTGEDRWAVEEWLLALERRELIRRDLSSTVEGETQYAFRHVLLCNVAYDEIPRVQRAEKHRLTAEWIESLGRPEDHTDLLSHHYLAALELAQATRQDTADLSERARLVLRDAGDRALALSAFTAAVPYYRQSLELWPADDRGRPYLLLRYGKALRWAEDEGEDELAEARAKLIGAGDPESAAEADLLLADIAIGRGQRDRGREHLDRASALVADVTVSRSKAYVLGHLARFHMLDREHEEAIELGRQALSLADELGLDELRPQVLTTVGSSRVVAGDPAGVHDLEESIELAFSLHSGPDVLRGYNNLAVAFDVLGDVRRKREALEEGLQAAERFGERIPAMSLRSQLPFVLCDLGDWDKALQLADEFIAEVGGGRTTTVINPFIVRSAIRLARDDATGALADARALVEHSQQLGTADQVIFILILAWTTFEVGSKLESEQLADESLAIAGTGLPDAPFAAVALHRLGREREARLVLERAPKTRWREAAELELRSELVQAAHVYSEIGVLPEEARIRLMAAERLAADGRRAEAEEQLEMALGFYRSVGATRYIRQCEELRSALA